MKKKKRNRVATTYFDDGCQVANHNPHVFWFVIGVQYSGIGYENTHVVIGSNAKQVHSFW